MKGQITLTLDNHNIGSIDADQCPDLFLELATLARGGTVPSAKARKTSSPKETKAPKAAKATGGPFETRTQAGRDALDATVMDALGAVGDWVKVEKLGIPAEPAQVRSSLHRLVEAGAVKRRGQARGTEYLNVKEAGSAAKAGEAAPAAKAAKPKGKAKKKAPPKPAAKKRAASKGKKAGKKKGSK